MVTSWGNVAANVIDTTFNQPLRSIQVRVDSLISSGTGWNDTGLNRDRTTRGRCCRARD
jgi:hypothetical protein